MIKNKQTFFLGIFVLLVWIFFGIPTSWKVTLTVLSAIYLVVLSVKITLPRKGNLKHPRRKEKITPVFSESAPVIRMESTVSSNNEAINNNES